MKPGRWLFPLFILLIPLPIHGYAMLGYKWFNEDMPVNFYVNMDYIEDTVPEGYQEEAAILGFQAWEEVECSSLYFEYMGTDAPYGWNDDGYNVLSFGDLNDWLGEGVLGATFPLAYDQRETYHGYSFFRYRDADIIFNDGINWGTIEDVESSSCISDYDLLGVATHEIGHLAGLAHSCESWEPCSDPKLREAVMYWVVGSCDSHQSYLAEDDIDGLNFIYGIYVDFAGSPQKGALPLAVEFSLIPSEIEEEITAISWSFGDGETSSETAPSHTYTEEGEYTVILSVTGDSAECQDYEEEVKKVAYITVCDIPSPDFTFEFREDRTVKFVNTTPFEIYGCTTGYQWDFGDGSTGNEREPYHTFDEDGAYMVSLTAEGPAGVSDPVAKEVVVSLGGCSISGMAPPLPRSAIYLLPILFPALIARLNFKRIFPSG